MLNSLGNLEEMILLVTAVMQDEAYGVTITEKYRQHTQHSISLSAVHTVLRRLEKKGLIESYMGGATRERGGRRKRIFKVTSYGLKVIATIQVQRARLWNEMPDMSLG
jgi:DNA-binding PadR family transcriptional regulator